MFDITHARASLKEFFSNGKREFAARKAVIIPYDDLSDRVFLVVEGYVKVGSHGSTGSEHIHYLYGPGDFFPVIRLFSDIQVRAEFVAFPDIVILSKPVTDTMRFFEDDPHAMLAIMRQQASTYSRIVNLNMGKAKHRVAYRILILCQRFGKRQADHIVIEVPITLQDIANMVRLTRESVGKVMAELEREGRVHFGRRNIIAYPDKLQELAEE